MHIATLGTQAARAASEHDARTLYRLVEALAKSTPKPPPIIKDATGRPVDTSVDAARRWLEYFAGVHAGTVEDQ
eukprot:9316600-Alexandrium_andersonii.AAC.1